MIRSSTIAKLNQLAAELGGKFSFTDANGIVFINCDDLQVASRIWHECSDTQDQLRIEYDGGKPYTAH